MNTKKLFALLIMALVTISLTSTTALAFDTNDDLDVDFIQPEDGDEHQFTDEEHEEFIVDIVGTEHLSEPTTDTYEFVIVHEESGDLLTEETRDLTVEPEETKTVEIEEFENYVDEVDEDTYNFEVKLDDGEEELITMISYDAVYTESLNEFNGDFDGEFWDEEFTDAIISIMGVAIFLIVVTRVVDKI